MSNRNIINLARLYDCIAKELHDAIATGAVSFNDNRIKDKVAWLGQIAKTLSLVYQIEQLRAKPAGKEAGVNLPAEENVEDPAAKRAHHGKMQAQPFTAGGQPHGNDIPHFPGKWTP